MDVFGVLAEFEELGLKNILKHKNAISCGFLLVKNGKRE